MERETVITFNDEEDIALVYSCQRPIWTKMKRLGAEPSRTFYKNGVPIGYQFQVPKKWIKISKTKVMSEENKKAARERAKIAFKPKNVDSNKGNPK